MGIKSTIILLRLPFSIFLLPIYLLPLVFLGNFPLDKAILLGVILHLLIYPSSNGYNSFYDNDEGPIGGLAKPPKPQKSLLFVCMIFDILALGLSFFVSLWAVLGNALYILASRLYSHPRFKLKKRPILSLLLIGLGQGGVVYLSTILSFATSIQVDYLLIGAIATSFFLAGVYPLGQIYQHDADKKAGVLSFSRMVGIRATFYWSLGFLGIGLSLLAYLLAMHNSFLIATIFGLFLAPAFVFFILWMIRTIKNESQANFKNLMIMNILSSSGLNVFLISLLFGIFSNR